MAKRDPGKKQKDILNYLQQCGENPPTVEEIRKACGLSSKSLVVYHLRKLEAQGEIYHLGGLPRGIGVSHDADHTDLP